MTNKLASTAYWDEHFRLAQKATARATVNSWDERFRAMSNPPSLFRSDFGVSLVMHSGAIKPWLDFTAKNEGRTNFLYTDSTGLVTTGIGNLVDAGPRSLKTDSAAAQPWTPAPVVFGYPWTHGVGGSPASRDEIQEAWTAVKAAWPAVKSFASQSLTDLRLSDTVVNDIVESKMAENERYIIADWPGYVEAPADAQFVVMAMAWAIGGGVLSKFPAMKAALIKEDYAEAARQSHCGNCAPARNTQAIAGLLNADRVAKLGLDRSKLYWPNSPPESKPFNKGLILLPIALAAGAAGYVYRDEVTAFAKSAYKTTSKTVGQAYEGAKKVVLQTERKTLKAFKA